MALTRPRASQIYDIDYKQATRVVTVANITLSGGAPSQVDGVNLSLNDRVLVTGQSTLSQNGIYYVTTLGSGSNGTWSRSLDTNATGEILTGTIVMVTEGNIYADTQWKLITDGVINVGVTDQVWTQNYSANSISSGSSNVVVAANANVTISSAGTANVLTVSSTGAVISGTGSVIGNATVGNLLTTGLISATGNIAGGNISVTGNISALAGTFRNGDGQTNYTTPQITFGYNNTADYPQWIHTRHSAGVTYNNAIDFYTNDGTQNAAFTANAILGLTVNQGRVGIANPEPSYALDVTGTANITGNILTSGSISATGNVAAGNVNTSIVSATGQIVTTAAGNLGTGAGQIYLNGASENRIDWNTNGTGAPTFTTRSAGAKLDLYPSLSGSSADYALGVEAGALWLGIPGNDSGQYIKFYGGTTEVANISGTGVMSVLGNVTGANFLTAGQVSATGNIFGNVGNLSSLQLNNTVTPITAATGQAFWDTGEHTVTLGMENGVQQQIGLENYMYVKADAAITNGQAVMFVGANGTNILAAPADTTSVGFRPEYIIGVATQDIAINGFGYITVYGLVHSLNTNAYNVGDILWVDNATPGALTNVQPSDPNFQIQMAAVTKKAGGDGHIMVRPTPFYDINRITNVLTTSPTDGQALVYDSANSIWINSTIANVNFANTAATVTTNAQPNITSVGILSSLSATGNITGNYIFGNGSQLTGLPEGYGNANVANYLPTYSGNLSAGNISATGNTTSANFLTGGVISATGNIDGGNVTTAGLVTATGNITGGNIITAGIISATGAAYTGNIYTSGGISLTGNTITSSGATLTIDPNGSGAVDGDVIIAGNLSVQGNVTYIDSNVITTNEKSITLANNVNTGSLADGAGIDVGNNNLAYWRFNNATTSWQSNIDITPAANNTLNLGGTSNYWANIYANNTFIIGSESVTGNITGGNVTTVGLVQGGTVSATGNVTGGNVTTAGQISATGNITGNYILGDGSQLTGLPGGASLTNGNSNVVVGASANITVSVAGTSNVVVFASTGEYVTGVVSATGNITGGNILGDGRNLTGINAFSSIAVSGQDTVLANTIASTLTLVAGNNIQLTTSNTANTITIAYSSGGGGGSIFATGGDMGTVDESVTSSEDLGLVTDSVTTSYDLGQLGVDGVVTGSDIIANTITMNNLATNIAISTTGNITFANISTGSSNSDVRGWWYDSNSKSVSSQESSATDVQLNSDGTKMYVVGTTNQTIYQYDLSTAYDVSSATYATLSSSVSAQDTSPQALALNGTNSALYMLGQTNKTVYQYTIGSGNIATLAYDSKSFSVNSEETAPTGLAFGNSLGSMYVVGTTNKTVYQYNLGTPGDVSTASYASAINLNISSYGTNPRALAVDSGGSKFWVVDGTSGLINEFRMSTDWQVSTGVYFGSYYVGAQETAPTGIFVKLSQAKAYVIGSSSDTVSEYSTQYSTIATANSYYLGTSAQITGNLYTGGNISANGSGKFYGNLTADTGFLGTKGYFGSTTGTPTAYLHLAAGTNTANSAPLKFTSGTSLTTAEAGAMEYDGTALYFSPAAANRALNVVQHYYRSNANLTLGNVATAQSWLNVGVALQASTTYEFEGMFNLVTTGTTSHTEAIGFGGTATLTSISYGAQRYTNSTTATTPYSNYMFANTSTVITAAITTSQNSTYILKGVVQTNAAGTFIPQLTFSAAPGGTSTVTASAFFKLVPVGSNSGNTSIGTWA